MILPTKCIEEGDTLLAAGIDLLEIIGNKRQITSLWNNAKNMPSILTSKRYILALDLLFLFGLVDMQEDLIVRMKPKRLKD